MALPWHLPQREAVNKTFAKDIRKIVLRCVWITLVVIGVVSIAVAHFVGTLAGNMLLTGAAAVWLAACIGFELVWWKYDLGND